MSENNRHNHNHDRGNWSENTSLGQVIELDVADDASLQPLEPPLDAGVASASTVAFDIAPTAPEQAPIGAMGTLDAIDNASSAPLAQLVAPASSLALDPAPAETAQAPAELSLVEKGVNYVGDIYGSFTDADSLSSLPAIGDNAVAVTADFGIDAVDNIVYDNDVDGGYTESDADIAATVKEAVQTDGLSVMVRPLLDFLPGNNDTDNPLNGGYYSSEFRSYYYPGAAGSAGANSFFASYQTMIVREATLAQQNGATLFCIGAELDQITGPSYEAYWNSIISAVRAVFSGKLTYSADWDDADSPWQYAGGTNITVPPVGTGDITTQVSFWSKLDYVGIDEYAPISDATNPTLQDLINGWTKTPTDAETLSVTGQQSLISYYQGISATLKLPLLFTELGYANSSDAAIDPASPGSDQDGNPDNATADPTLQANLYQAFFTAWQQNGNGSLAGTYLWNWEPGGAGVSPFSVQGLPAQTQVADGYTACFATGTRIGTPSGEVVVEQLRVGDMVQTASGEARQVIWIGHRHIRFMGAVGEPHPVHVKAHAFSPGRPHRDLILSPEHAVFVDGVLIPIRRLVNGATIVPLRVRAITYWHVELTAHDILLAEGLAAESYLDTGNRSSFANAPVSAVRVHFERGRWTAWANKPCAPLIDDGPILQAARARLAARAEALGHVLPLVREFTIVAEGSVSVVIAPSVGVLRLISQSFRPTGDRRRLGALLVGLWIDGVRIAPDDPMLATGFHEIEAHGATQVRWTDGRAELALGEGSEDRLVRLEIAAVMNDDDADRLHRELKAA